MTVANENAHTVVLVADDEPDLRSLVQYSLRGAGYAVGDVPATEAELRERVTAGNAAHFGADANVVARIPVDDHVRDEGDDRAVHGAEVDERVAHRGADGDDSLVDGDDLHGGPFERSYKM